MVGGDNCIDGDESGVCDNGSRFSSDDCVDIDGVGDRSDSDMSAVMTVVMVASSAVTTGERAAASLVVTAVTEAGSVLTFSSTAIVALTAVTVPHWR